MKAFISALLAGAACAANTKNWNGLKVVVGTTQECTPTGQSSWSGTASKVLVTFQQKMTMKAAIEKDDYAQSWTCFVDGAKTDCLFWQVKGDATNVWTIKGSNYNNAAKDKQKLTVTGNVKDWLESSGSGFKKLNHSEYKQTGDNTSPAKVSVETTKSNYKYKSGKLNGKTFTGEMTREYVASETTGIYTSGKKYTTASIGAFAKDNSASKKEGSIKDVTVEIAKKPTVKTASTTTKDKKGAKKTWTGPKITGDN